MTSNEVLTKLQSLSNEKVFAHNKKYGASDNQFGVKLGDIRSIAKSIKTDHSLALELWETGNVDARLLSILILDPKKLAMTDLDRMVKSLDFSHVSDWLNNYIIKEHPAKDQLQKEWLNSDNKWAVRSGWSLLAGKIAKGADDINLEQLLNTIEKEMPKVAEEIQWTMNTALAYIGIHHPVHRQRALDIGNKLGIYKDFPVSKGCTSPFAPIWINEMMKRQKA